ncbi:MAG TPA: pentapeptide repeat-containing protein [Ktedonobacteraceae bacterium]
MIQLFIVSALIGLLAALVGTFVAMKIQSRSLMKLHAQQEAWQRAQEAQQRIWEVRQGSHALDVEKKLASQVQQVEENRQSWEARDEQRIATMSLEFQGLISKLNLEHELAKLPHIDETPLPSSEDGQRQRPFKDWRPPTFCGADLNGRDLSNRYLVRADFREASLRDTNFYMADLRGACLTGADLTGSNLSGADLSGADLRSAILKGTNFLVTDMHNALLNGADLRGVRNLTAEQAYSAIFDNATQFDADVDVTMPRLPSIHFTVYTESTPLLSLQSSAIMKQLETSRNTIEAAPAVVSPEPAEAADTQDDPLADAFDMILPETPIPVEVPETEDAIPEGQDSGATESITVDDLPDTPEELRPDLLDTVPQPSISPVDLQEVSDEPVLNESEMVAGANGLPEPPVVIDEPVLNESEMVAGEPSSTDVPDIPSGSLEDTLEMASVEADEPGDLMEQPSEAAVVEIEESGDLMEQPSETSEDSQWVVPEVTNHSNGKAENHADGTPTNGASTTSPDLTPLIEQPIDDAPLMPPPSNGNSHGPVKTGPRSNKQGNRRIGEAGKVSSRKRQSGKRRAKSN